MSRRRRIPRVFRSKSKCRGRDRSDLVFRGASERKSAVLWPKLNERGSSLSHPAGFYSIRDATAEIADTPCGSSPTSLRTRRRLWKLFYRPRGGGNGKRHEDEKRERTDGDRDQDRGREREREHKEERSESRRGREGTNGGGWLMFHHGEWKSGTPWGLGIKMAVTRNRGLCSSCGKPQREEAAWKEPLSSLRSHPPFPTSATFFSLITLSPSFSLSFLFFFSPLGATLFPPLRPSLSSCFLFAAFHREERGRYRDVDFVVAVLLGCCKWGLVDFFPPFYFFFFLYFRYLEIIIIYI